MTSTPVNDPTEPEAGLQPGFVTPDQVLAAKEAMNMSYESSLYITAFHGSQELLSADNLQTRRISRLVTATMFSGDGLGVALPGKMGIMGGDRGVHNGMAAMRQRLGVPSQYVGMQSTLSTSTALSGVSVTGRMIFDGSENYKFSFDFSGGNTNFDRFGALEAAKVALFDEIYNVQPWLVQVGAARSAA